MDNPSGTDLLIGYSSLFVSCLCFGFLFAPLKRCDTKDGFFVQWVQCAVVFLVGLIINIARGLPPFNLVAAIGGFLYATGNVASVPIVTEMGIGLGMLMSGTFQLLVGWFIARFGLFGTKKQHIESPLINNLGVLIIQMSGAMLMDVYQQKVKTANDAQNGISNGGEQIADHPSQNNRQSTTVPLCGTADGKTMPTRDSPYGSVSSRNECCSTNGASPSNDGRMTEETDGTEEKLANGQSDDWHRLFNVRFRKWIFWLLAVCFGCLNGAMLTPIVYVQDNDKKASENVLDFVFSHFCAVFFFSTLYFLLYSLFRRCRPFVHSSLVLPSVAYGLLWSVGMTLFIVSNRILSQQISLPITVQLSAIIGVAVDLFLFKDIRVKRHLILFILAIGVGFIGFIIVALSFY